MPKYAKGLGYRGNIPGIDILAAVEEIVPNIGYGS